ncbi:MAG: hypothetical protein E7375_00135 [Clostridiales bacterium]|nr:hypothetical protein [Clostridiales bacterium]
MIITITGKPCSGKSTISRLIAEKYGFKRIGVGDMFKAEAAKRGISTEEFNALCLKNPEYDYLVDEQSAKLGKELEGQKVVFDSRLAWHFVPKSFKVFVDLNDEEMARRLANSDRTGKEQYKDLNEAMRTLKSRRDLENERYKKIYNVDLTNLSNFDYVISSLNKTPEEVTQKIMDAYKKFCIANG